MSERSCSEWMAASMVGVRFVFVVRRGRGDEVVFAETLGDLVQVGKSGGKTVR